jgi:hypothetical protein
MMPSSSADDNAGGGGGDNAADDSEATPAPPPDVDDDRAAPPGGLAIRPIKPTPPLAPPSFKDVDDENEMTKDGRRTISAGKRLSRSTGSPRRL